MTEKNWWTRHLRPRLHKPPNHLAYKVQDAFVKGLPDLTLIQGGQTYWVELKTLDHAPVREGTPWRIGVTAEQRRWLQAWNRAWYNAYGDDLRGSIVPPAFVLLWVDREKKWYALDPSIPDECDQSDFADYVIRDGDIDTLTERLFR